METHHPHHITHKKKWTEYLLEFFMLFLAVFLGFVAENIREHIVEHNREKEYIKSFVEDLKSDIRTTNKTLERRKERQIQLDSLFTLLKNKRTSGLENELYYFGRLTIRGVLFTNNDRTITQLKNSGGMRLIKNTAASDSIMSYYRSIEAINYSLSREADEVKAFYPFLSKIYDPYEMDKQIAGDGSILRPTTHPKLKSTDPELLSEFAFYIHSYKTGLKNLNARLERLKAQAEAIIQYLKKEYHLEK